MVCVLDYDGSCDFVVGGDTGLQVKSYILMVCTHTRNTTYQYKTSTIVAMARALVTPAARARVDFLYTSRPTAAFSTRNYRMHACNLDVLMKACVPMCTAVCMVR